MPVIGQYPVNIPHQMFKVCSAGDTCAPKHASASVEARYRSVRIIAAYGAAQLPQKGLRQFTRYTSEEKSK